MSDRDVAFLFCIRATPTVLEIIGIDGRAFAVLMFKFFICLLFFNSLFTLHIRAAPTVVVYIDIFKIFYISFYCVDGRAFVVLLFKFFICLLFFNFIKFLEVTCRPY
ncbi:hypothetical protein, partial [Peptoniphilus indolicus]|uniref:hypothetical protein n=1 Tax=Peptoniphilus indolicus TaxID=33030 RepID=UPI001C54CDB6